VLALRWLQQCGDRHQHCGDVRWNLASCAECLAQIRTLGGKALERDYVNRIRNHREQHDVGQRRNAAHVAN
jgi:hypothetical protein